MNRSTLQKNIKATFFKVCCVSLVSLKLNIAHMTIKAFIDHQSSQKVNISVVC